MISEAIYELNGVFDGDATITGDYIKTKKNVHIIQH